MGIASALNLAALNAEPEAHHLNAARAFVRACHADCDLTFGQVEEWARRRAEQREFQAAVDAGRADAVERAERAERQVEQLQVALRHRGYVVDDLQQRIDEVLKRAAEVDPESMGRLGVALHHDLPTILRRSTDCDAEVAGSMARHPARGPLPTLDDFNE